MEIRFTLFNRLPLLLIIGACFLSASLASSQTPPPRYRIAATLQRLPKFRGLGDFLEVSALNRRGEAVGACFDDPYTAAVPRTNAAFIWRQGKTKALGRLPGYFNSSANGINNSGEVVGIVSTYEGPGERAFVWQDGKMRLLPLLPGTVDSDATAINDKGQIVGFCGDHACLWNGGRAYDLGPGEATRINSREQIVGYEQVPASGTEGKAGGLVSRALLWGRGHRTILGAGIPRGLNDKGQIIIVVDQEEKYSYLWQQGRIWRIGIPNMGKDIFYVASDINTQGQIMGNTEGGVSSWWPFLWQHGKMFNLNGLMTPSQKYFLGGFTVAGNDKGQFISDSNKEVVLLSPISGGSKPRKWGKIKHHQRRTAF